MAGVGAPEVSVAPPAVEASRPAVQSTTENGVKKDQRLITAVRQLGVTITAPWRGLTGLANGRIPASESGAQPRDVPEQPLPSGQEGLNSQVVAGVEPAAAEAKKLEAEAYMKITTLLRQDIAADADPERLMQKLHDEKGWVTNDKTIDYIKGAIKFKQDKVAEEARIAAEATAATTEAHSPEVQTLIDQLAERDRRDEARDADFEKMRKNQEGILKYLAEKETDPKKKKSLLKLLAEIGEYGAMALAGEALGAVGAEATGQRQAA